MPELTPEEEAARRLLAELSIEQLICEIERRVDHSAIILQRNLGDGSYDSKRACQGDKHILLGMCCEFQDWLLGDLREGKSPARTF